MAKNDLYPGAPKWVKAFATAVIVILVGILLLMVFLGGDHGPWRHLPEAPAVDLSGAPAPGSELATPITAAAAKA